MRAGYHGEPMLILAQMGHRPPHPLGRPLQARERLGRVALPVLHGPEPRKERVQWPLSHPYVLQDVSGEDLQLLCRCDAPLEHGMRGDREPPGGAPDTQACGQAGDDAHDALDRGALTMQDRAQGREAIAATGATQQLPPGPALGMALGTELAPARPSPIGTGRVRAAMGGGVDRAAGPSRRHAARWGGAGDRRAAVAGGRTGVAGRLAGEARKGCRLAPVLAPWWRRGRWRRACGSGVAEPRPLEHDVPPDECTQRKLVEEKVRYHGNTPSDTCCNEGIVPGLSGG